MPEYIEREAAGQNESICRSCFHSYVCEQFNEHRDGDNKKCHFYNDHFVPIADVVEVVRCKDCKHYKPQDKSKRWIGTKKYCCRSAAVKVTDNDYCSFGEKMDGKGEGE